METDRFTFSELSCGGARMTAQTRADSVDGSIIHTQADGTADARVSDGIADARVSDGTADARVSDGELSNYHIDFAHSHACFDDAAVAHTHLKPDDIAVAHTHLKPDGSVVTHVHSVGSVHTHSHDPEDMRKIVNRISKIVGHMEAVKRMIEEGEDCPDVIIQLAAVKAAVNSVGRLMIKEHMEHCIVDAIEEKDDEALQKLNDAIDRFIK
jgi:DNA-binding FrmR family transcriptional regulator